MKKFLPVLLLVLLLPLTGCSKAVTRSNLSLDTIITLTLYDGPEEAMDKAYALIDGYNSSLNANDPNSVISKIGTNGEVLSDDLYGLVSRNLAFAKETNGAYSPVLGSLTKLWAIDEPVTKEAPTSEQVALALSHTSLSALTVDDKTKTAVLSDPESSVNLGASAKGFIGDRLTEMLKEEGVTKAVLNLGGNVVLIGQKSIFEKFSVGIDNPYDTQKDPIAVLKLADCSIVTSGDYQRYFTDSAGKHWHHIFDPQTGYPSDSGLAQTVVVAESSETADMLSTTLFVMGKDRGLAFLEKIDPDGKIGAIFTDHDGHITVTSNLKDAFSLSPEYSDSFTVTTAAHGK